VVGSQTLLVLKHLVHIVTFSLYTSVFQSLLHHGPLQNLATVADLVHKITSTRNDIKVRLLTNKNDTQGEVQVTFTLEQAT
jgi:hypothetical protein